MNTIKQSLKALALCAAVAVSVSALGATKWTFNGSNTITSDDGVWGVSVSKSGTSLTVNKVSTWPTKPADPTQLDLRLPITDENGTEYQITGFVQAAFENVTCVSEIDFPRSMTEISKWCFKNCSNLAKVVFEQPSQLTTINDCAFQSSGKLGTIEPYLPASVTSVGGSAFQHCKNATETLAVGAPGQTFSFGNASFEGNTPKIVDIRATDGTSFSTWVFSGVTTIKEMRLHHPLKPTFSSANALNNIGAKAMMLSVPRGSYISAEFELTPLADGELAAFQSKFPDCTETPLGTTKVAGNVQWVVPYDEPFLEEGNVLLVQSEPLAVAAAQVSPGYGFHPAQTFPVTVTAPATGLSAASDNYSCAGYTLQKYEGNGVWGSAVESADTSVTIAGEEGASYRVIWHWSQAGARLIVSKPTEPYPVEPIGTVKPDPEPSSGEDGYVLGTTVTLTAVPAAGCEFVRWCGPDVPEGHETDATITITVDAQKEVSPLFHGHRWIFDPTAKTITDGVWTLPATASGANLTVSATGNSKIYSRDLRTLINLRDPVVDADGAAYTITSIAAISFSGNDYTVFLNTVADLRLPETVTSYGNYVGQNLWSLTNLVLSAKLESVGICFFNSCSVLRTVTPFLPPKLLNISSACFQKTAIGGSLSIGYPKCGDITLGNACFENCTFTNLEIYGSVSSVERWAFAGVQSVYKVYCHGGYFTGQNLFNTVGDYTQLWFVPKNNPTWDFTDETKFKPFDEATMGTTFRDRYPDEPKLPKAVSKTLPANQWYQTWMPPELAPGMKLIFR